MEYVLEAENLKKTFGDLVAVDGVSFRIKQRECFGLLGPNGAGKTTTVRMVYGFTPVGEGNLKVFGLDVRKDLRRIKYRLGVCQQEDNLDPDLTLLQNMEIFARYFDIPRKEARGRIDGLLKFIALDHRRKTKVDELSGGMKRRLVLARALVNEPDLLILDEPTTGLDPQSRHQVWEKLEELKAKGLSVLLTTHAMDEASRLCDRLLIMDHGRILVEGRPGELVERHVGRNVIEVSEPSGEVRKFVTEKELEHEDVGHRLMIYLNDGDRLFKQISTSFCREGCILRMATLEDVFLKLTGRELRE
jgi:lipooligosaccharide transport system ATP-binding protein